MPRLNLRRLGLFGLAVGVLLAAAHTRGETVGDALAPWSPGGLDIHHINTGRGNATLLVLPDGTTLLVDAGDGGNLPPRGTPPRPDASRPPAEWIARYVRAMGVSAIDYGYVTHFHADHMGGMADLAKRVPRESHGRPRMAGLRVPGGGPPRVHDAGVRAATSSS